MLQIKIFSFLRKPNYVNINLVKFQLQSLSQQKDIENRNLLPICNGTFSSQNAPNFKLLFLGLLKAYIMGQKNLEYFNFLKSSKILYYTKILWNNTHYNLQKGHQKWILLRHSKKQWNMRNSMMMFTFSVFDRKYLIGQIWSKKSNC